MPFTVGLPVRDLTGSWLCGVRPRKIKAKERWDALFSQHQIKIFDDIDSAKLYASTLRQTFCFPKTTVEKSRVAPVYTIEVNNKLLPSFKKKQNIETDNNTSCLEYYEAGPEVITKLIKTDYFDSDLPSYLWKKQDFQLCAPTQNYSTTP